MPVECLRAEKCNDEGEVEAYYLPMIGMRLEARKVLIAFLLLAMAHKEIKLRSYTSDLIVVALTIIPLLIIKVHYLMLS